MYHTQYTETGAVIAPLSRQFTYQDGREWTTPHGVRIAIPDGVTLTDEDMMRWHDRERGSLAPWEHPADTQYHNAIKAATRNAVAPDGPIGGAWVGDWKA